MALLFLGSEVCVFEDTCEGAQNVYVCKSDFMM